MSYDHRHPRTPQQVRDHPQHDAHVCVWDKMLQDKWEAQIKKHNELHTIFGAMDDIISGLPHHPNKFADEIRRKYGIK